MRDIRLNEAPIIENVRYFVFLTRFEMIAARMPNAKPAIPTNHSTSDAIPHISAAIAKFLIIPFFQSFRKVETLRVDFSAVSIEILPFDGEKGPAAVLRGP